MKAKTIQAFAGDSILLQVAVYDDRDQAFDLVDNKIQTALFEVIGADIAEQGVMSSNMAQFTVGAEKTSAGSYPYRVVLLGDGLRFTVAYGTLNVMRAVE